MLLLMPAGECACLTLGVAFLSSTPRTAGRRLVRSLLHSFPRPSLVKQRWQMQNAPPATQCRWGESLSSPKLVWDAALPSAPSRASCCTEIVFESLAIPDDADEGRDAIAHRDRIRAGLPAGRGW